MTQPPSKVYLVLCDKRPLRVNATIQGAGQCVADHVDVRLGKAGMDPLTDSQRESVVRRIVETGSFDLNSGSKRDEAVLGTEVFNRISHFVQRLYEVHCHEVWP